ncbi:MAG: phosphohydrolase [Planctomycetaceae bacterium]
MNGIVIKASRPRLDAILARHADAIGGDLPGYRNHVHRTVTYAMHFLGGDPAVEPVVETALAYHDVGLWTDGALAYLEPSEAVALADNERFGWGFDHEVLRGIIHWHHKILPYRGPHAAVIESCRKADWIDASMGWLRKGMPRRAIRAVEAAFPNEGFHAALVRLAKDLGGSTIGGGVKVVRGIVKW